MARDSASKTPLRRSLRISNAQEQEIEKQQVSNPRIGSGNEASVSFLRQYLGSLFTAKSSLPWGELVADTLDPLLIIPTQTTQKKAAPACASSELKRLVHMQEIDVTVLLEVRKLMSPTCFGIRPSQPHCLTSSFCSRIVLFLHSASLCWGTSNIHAASIGFLLFGLPLHR